MNNPNYQNMNMNMMGQPRAHQIVTHYRSQQGKAAQAWQQAVAPEERAHPAVQFFTFFRLLKPEVAETEAMRNAIHFETQAFNTSPSKEQYSATLKQKLLQMTNLRQQRLAGMQINNTNGMNPAQMGMMGQAGMQGPRQNPPQQFPQAFPNPQLQRPMQASPIPMSQGQSSMGMNGTNAMNLQQQGQNTPQPNMQQPPQQGQVDNNTILAITKRLMSGAKPDVIARIRQDVEQWPPERRQQLINQGIDPIFLRFRQQAEMMLRSGKLNLASLQGGQAANQNGMQPGQPNPMVAQQLNMNRQSNQEFDFNAIMNHQNEALRAQDQGQQVVPASNNANTNQMVGFPGQNGQPGQTMAQRQAAQAFNNANLQRQAQAQAQSQQLQAQAQAQARQQQLQQQQAAQRNAQGLLQGQIGGLNMAQGAQQSPAMPMLTRPMVPPGPPGPTTPQQRPQAHVPQMTAPNQHQIDPQVATQLMREAQQRAAAAQQGQQPLTEQLRLSLMPPEMPAHLKAQMLKVPEPQFRGMLAQFVNTMRRNQAMQNGGLANGQQPPSQAAAMMMNPALLQAGMQGQMLNGGNMGGTPGMAFGQQAPNAMPGQQLPIGQRPGIPQQQRLQSAQNLLQQSPGIITATDNNAFPPNVLNAQIRQSLPPDLKTWAQLKQWAGQNPNSMPNIDPHKLLLLQVLHFQDQLMRQKAGLTPGANLQQNGTGALAPQAQMGPGQGATRTPQPPPSMAAMGPIQVSPQELQQWRQKMPQMQRATDEQLRNFIMSQKLNQRKQLQQQQMLQAQRNQAAQPQPATSAQGPQVSRPQPAPPQPTQPAQPSQPVQPSQAPTQPKAANKSQQPPKATQATGNSAMNKGVKRPNEDNADSNTEAPMTNVAPQAPAMVPSKSSSGIPNLTQEQISKLPPNQQAQMRAQLLKAQDASNNKSQQRAPGIQEMIAKIGTPEMQQKYRAMLMEEERKMPRGQTVQLSSQGRELIQHMVRAKLPQLRKIEYALRLFVASYESTQSEDLARDIMRRRTQLLRNINPADGKLHDEITMSEVDFQNNIKHILGFVGKVMARFGSQQTQGNAGQPNQQQPQASGPQTQNPQPPAQLNAANLRLLDETSKRQQKAPSAPITDRPPFPLGGQQPGVPTYFEGAPKVENLRLPDKKKARLDSQASTPAPKQSPRIGTGKDSSPELKRMALQQKPTEQRPTFKCKIPDCDYSARGFDSPAELEAHVKEAHAKIDDPVQYTLEAMADVLEVDPKTGRSKADLAAANRIAKPTSAPKTVPQPMRAGQTPNISQNVVTPAGQQAVATPMTRIPTQQGFKSSPSTNLLKTPQTGAKVATPSTGAPTKATPASLTKAPTKEVESALAPEALMEGDSQPFVPLSLFDYSYNDVLGALDSTAPFTVLDLKDEDTAWALRDGSPTNSPSSSAKDTPSTRQSDISENDNLQINLDIKMDMDVPDAWMAALQGETLPLDVQLSDDLQNLGVTLPPMNDDDMMLFYGDSYMMDLDSMDSKMMESLGTLDPSLLSTN